MIRKVLFAVPLLTTIAAVQAAEPFPEWPAGTMDENDPRVLAVYKAQCTQWAEENQLIGDAKTAYIANCQKDMPDMWPVGFEKSSGGGDDG